MDNLTLIVTILTAILTFLVGKAILSSRFSQASRSLEIKGRARKVNESLYELHKPSVPPSVQVVLFHGLQPGGYLDAHLRTWQNEDGSCVWPQTWLVDADPEAKAIPGAHVLSVSFNQGLENISHGQIDMYVMTEYILSDLLQANVGQEDYCPVVLVGHSIGGLVIKQLCNQAHRMLNKKEGLEKAKLEKFLNNIQCIFYYATPHHGTSIPKKWEKELPRALLTYFKALSKDTERLNHEFDNLDRVCNNWSFSSLGEDHATNLGPSNDRAVLVPEASARVGDFNIVNGADHFSICQPRDRSSRSFCKLKELVHHIASEAQDAKNREVMRLQEEARVLENWRPENFQFVPKSVTGLDIQVQELKSKLDNANSRTLGLVGMGGLGKTTLAKEVFNRLAPSFDYTCFIPNVKLIAGDEMEIKDKIGKNMHFHGKKVKNDQGWRTKPLLLVLDDTDGVRDEKVLSEMDETLASEARIIFTSRNQCPLEFAHVCKVEFLTKIRAKQLFLSYAFRDDQASATKFQTLTDAIVTKCEGLPLALEVLGKFLGTTKDYNIWEQTLHAMDRAQDHTDVNERLWGKLRASYDNLEENLQQIFLDAATFFNDNGWSLGQAKIAWRAAYDCHDSVHWKKLVDMSLVYDVEDDKPIQLHEQLQSLGRKIVSEPINSNRRRVWERDEGLRLLQNVKELREKGIFALRVSHDSDFEESKYEEDDDGSEDGDNDKKIHIRYTAVDSLVDLRYLEVNVPIVLDGAQGLPFQPKLVVLDCKWPDLAEVLLPALGDNIAILKLHWNKHCLPTYIGSFPKLRSLTFHRARHLKRLPEEFGNLSQLQELFLDCSQLQALPDSFGQLYALMHLEFTNCDQLQALPDSVGQLSALTHLVFQRCDQLQGLPDSLGQLSALTHLEFGYCPQLQGLPDSLGQLSALIHLQVCGQLQVLPDSVGQLSALTHLVFQRCDQLQGLPDSSGQLSALTHLVFGYCPQLQGLPDSLGQLSALTHLEFGYCPQLQALPDSLGQLSALMHLEFSTCGQLQALPDSLGQLSALMHLEFNTCDQLQALPDSFGQLSALMRLGFNHCYQLQALPDSFGQLSALMHLGFTHCHQLQALPNSFGQLSALKYLGFVSCRQLQALPDSLGQLSALTHLAFRSSGQLQALPDSLGQLSALTYLGFEACYQLQGLPDSFGQLSALTHLEFRGCDQLQALPDSFGQLSALTHLAFDNCYQLQGLPDSFGQLSALTHLEFGGCDQLQALPDSFGQLSALTYLEFGDCDELQGLPDSFGQLYALPHLEFVNSSGLQGFI